MAILVTGGAGYIGSHVVRQLTEAGKKVVVLDNLSTGFAQSLLYNEKLVVGDIGNIELVKYILKEFEIESVMHFAASIVVPESVKDPIKYYQNNTGSFIVFLGACTQHGIKNFVFSSTAAVYGGGVSGLFSEDDFTQPSSPYGTSKLMAEWILRDVAKISGLNHIIFRYFNVAGADPQGRMGQRSQISTHLIKVCCEAALGKREDIPIFGQDYETHDGTCLRDYIHVEDLAQAHLLGLKFLETGGESKILNVGYGKGHSVLDVIKTAREVSGVNFKAVPSNRRAGDTPVLIAKSEAIKEVLGWQPRLLHLDNIVEDAWRWEKKLGESWP